MSELSVYDLYSSQRLIAMQGSCTYSTVGMKYESPEDYAEILEESRNRTTNTAKSTAAEQPNLSTPRKFTDMFQFGEVNYGTCPRRQLRGERLIDGALQSIEEYAAINAEIRNETK